MKNRTPFTFIDLFAGIGGFHEALTDLGGECVLACDNDPDCELIYRSNFRDTPWSADVIELTAPDKLSLIPPHDVLCAGFPCQPFSKSGMQLGLRDQTRGTLFFHIMEVIRARHPRFVILENVRNLAGPRHAETWRTIVRSLRAEGYRVADDPLVFSPHLLPLSMGGRPQVRERVYILAERTDGVGSDLETSPLVSNKPVGRWHPSRWNIEDFLDDDSTIPDLSRYQLRPEEIKWLDAWQDLVGRVKGELPGFPIWVESFADVPDVGSHHPDWKNSFLEKNAEFYRNNRRMINKWIERHGVAEFPSSRQKFEWQARGSERDIWNLLIHFRPSGIRVRPPTYVPALVAITQTSVVASRRRRITPREAARLQGLPPRHRLHPDPAVAYRQLGNAVNVGVTRYLARALFDASEAGWPGAKSTHEGRRRSRRNASSVQLRLLQSA